VLTTQRTRFIDGVIAVIIHFIAVFQRVGIDDRGFGSTIPRRHRRIQSLRTAQALGIVVHAIAIVVDVLIVGDAAIGIRFVDAPVTIVIDLIARLGCRFDRAAVAEPLDIAFTLAGACSELIGSTANRR
jgi:hypothetical protein